MSRKERNQRLTKQRNGAWGSNSVDFMRLVRLLYDHSERYAGKQDGNVSPYTLSAIPMLFSAIRCFSIEYEKYFPENQDGINKLTMANDFDQILDLYGIVGPLRYQAKLLQAVRHEIVHPVHMPTGTLDNWPEYLRDLKAMGVLQSTGLEDRDYLMFDQMHSHRLFGYGCAVMRDIAKRIILQDEQKTAHFKSFYASFNFGFNDPRDQSDCEGQLGNDCTPAL